MKTLGLKEWIKKVTLSLVKPNFYVGQFSNAVSTTTSYDVGHDFYSVNYKTNTGRFVVIGFVQMKTSRFTSRALIKINGSIRGAAGTNKTSLITMTPIAVYEGTRGNTYSVSLAIGSQDSGTTASIEQYNASFLFIFDLGGGTA